MKSKKNFLITLIIVIAVVLAFGTVLFIIIHNNARAPQKAVQEFYNSLLPSYNAEKLEQNVGSSVYKIRFDDDGRFVDRYERTRKQIVYYYGEEFESTLSDFSFSDVSDTEKSSIKREYSSKYSLDVEEIKKVSFCVTLSSELAEKSRTENVITLKIGGKWYVYDYDAYWFAYM